MKLTSKRVISFPFLFPSLCFGEDSPDDTVMIQDTIAELEARLQRAEVNPERKAELLQLISLLKSELAERGETQADLAHEAPESDFTDDQLREQRQAELSLLSLDEISDSVTRFEKSHPQLVHVVNRICQTLSNLGI
jgi:methylase of polypeptide subunit release factors